MESDNLDIIILVCETILPLIVNIFGFMYLTARILKVLRAGLLFNKRIPTTIKIKRVLLSLWILILVLQIIALFVSYRKVEEGRTVKYYLWINYGSKYKGESDRLFLLLPLILYLAVIVQHHIVIGLEGRSKINSNPFYSNLYFLICFLTYLTSCLLYPLLLAPKFLLNKPTLLLLIARTFVATLVVIYYFWKPKNFDLQFNEEGHLIRSLLSKTTTVHNTRRNTNPNLGLTIETYTIVVSEKVLRKPNENGVVNEYFVVYAKSSQGKTGPKIERTYRDFQSFEISLNNEIRGLDIECPSLDGGRSTNFSDFSLSRKNESMGEKDLGFNEKISNIKKFCKQLSKDVHYQSDSFFDFFEIERPEYDIDRYKRDSEIDISDKIQEDEEVSQERSGVMKNSIWSDYSLLSTEDYCQYFKVTFKREIIRREEHDYYEFTIQSLVEQDVVFNVSQRYSSFVQLAQDIKQSTKVRAPPLPPKLFTKDKNLLVKRGETLEEWLRLVTNERLYFCRELFEFINADSDSFIKYSTLNQLEDIMERNLVKINIVKHQMVTDEIESFVIFEIAVEIMEKATMENVANYKVFRRYKEFDSLLNELKLKFKKSNKKVPELPAKHSYLNPLGSDNTSKRQLKLNTFLMDLLAYPDIWNNTCFRKFLQFDSERVASLLDVSLSVTRSKI